MLSKTNHLRRATPCRNDAASIKEQKEAKFDRNLSPSILVNNQTRPARKVRFLIRHRSYINITDPLKALKWGLKVCIDTVESGSEIAKS